MNRSIKSTLALTLLLISSSSTKAIPFSTWQEKVAVTAVAGVASYVVGSLAYNYFFALTDEQEIEETLNFCHKTEMLYNDLSFTFGKEISLVTGSGDNAIFEALKPEISAKALRLPFYTYVVELDKHIKELEKSQSTLMSKKITLFERKVKLHKNQNYSGQEIMQLKKEFNDAIAQIDALSLKIDSLLNNLLEVRAQVTASTNYIIEAQQVSLESWLDRPDIDPYWYVAQPHPTFVVVPATTTYVEEHHTTIHMPAKPSIVSPSVSPKVEVVTPSSTTQNNNITMTFDPQVWCDRTDPFNS